MPVFSRCRASLVHCLVSSPRDHSLFPLCPVASLDSPHDHSLLDLTRRVVKTPKRKTPTPILHTGHPLQTHTVQTNSHTAPAAAALSLLFLLFTALDSLFRVSYRHDTPAHTAPHLDARGHRRVSCCCATTHTTTHKRETGARTAYRKGSAAKTVRLDDDRPQRNAPPTDTLNDNDLLTLSETTPQTPDLKKPKPTKRLHTAHKGGLPQPPATERLFCRSR